MNRLKVGALAVGLALAALCAYMCFTHEPSAERIDFSAESDGSAVMASTDYFVFVFTGEDAESIHWDFGDGTSVDDAVEVYKQYAEPGVYQVLCVASNGIYERYSGMTVTVTDAEEKGLLDGYGTEAALMAISSVLLLAGLMMRDEP